jgi:hypothetical protein
MRRARAEFGHQGRGAVPRAVLGIKQDNNLRRLRFRT